MEDEPRTQNPPLESTGVLDTEYLYLLHLELEEGVELIPDNPDPNEMVCLRLVRRDYGIEVLIYDSKHNIIGGCDARYKDYWY